MKRMIAIVLVILSLTVVLAGCSGTETDAGMTNGSTGSSTNGSAGANSSGSTDSGSAGMTQNPAPDAGNGIPSDNENGIIEEERPAAQDDNALEEFGDDMKDMADDAGTAIDDAIDGRSRRSGTGMTGGR